MRTWNILFSEISVLLPHPPISVLLTDPPPSINASMARTKVRPIYILIAHLSYRPSKPLANRLAVGLLSYHLHASVPIHSFLSSFYSGKAPRKQFATMMATKKVSQVRLPLVVVVIFQLLTVLLIGRHRRSQEASEIPSRHCRPPRDQAIPKNFWAPYPKTSLPKARSWNRSGLQG